MREGFCASILRLDSSICCVTRSADGLLENAQRCQPENESIYSNEAPTEVRFRVKSLTDECEYELTGNSAYNQLTFPMNGALLSVVVDKQADIVNLAENIAKFTRTQQDSKLPSVREEYPLTNPAKPRTSRGVRLNDI
ncbi:MAG: hypothetical protein ABSA92_10850 [Candidatus Bathyarchaeia archaeon]|jgi:hypothetical protein